MTVDPVKLIQFIVCQATGFGASLSPIRALMYKQFFFCPKGNSPLTADSIMRLDRLQTVIPDYPAFIPESFCLSPESVGVLMAMLRSLFGAKEEPEFEALKELVSESLPDEARFKYGG